MGDPVDDPKVKGFVLGEAEGIASRIADLLTLLRSDAVDPGPEQMYCETQLERARELVAGCAARLRRA